MQWGLTCNILDPEQSGVLSCWRQVFQMLSLTSSASVVKLMLITEFIKKQNTLINKPVEGKFWKLVKD